MGKNTKSEPKAGIFHDLKGSFSRGGGSALLPAKDKPRVSATWGSVKSRQSGRLFTAEEVNDMIKSAMKALQGGREDVDAVVAELIEDVTIDDIVVSGR